MPRFRKEVIQFYVYVIQIGNNKEVLYVNYASSVEAAFRRFIHRHIHIRNSVLRSDLCKSDNYCFSSAWKAERSCRRLIFDLERQGFEVIAGGPVHNPYWSVYVIEIDGNSRHVYVGETNYPAEKRFQQHVCKFNPARVLLKYDSFNLAMHLVKDYPHYTTKKDSLSAEASVADLLRAKGYWVEGGH